MSTFIRPMVDFTLIKKILIKGESMIIVAVINVTVTELHVPCVIVVPPGACMNLSQMCHLQCINSI